MILKPITKAVLIVLLLATHGCGKVISGGPYQATGIKIGEVTDKAAIVWTRLTRHQKRIGSQAPMPEILYHDSRTGELIKRKIQQFKQLKGPYRGHRGKSGFFTRERELPIGIPPIGAR